MAKVTIDSDDLSNDLTHRDDRYRELATLAGTTKFDVFGRMVRIWGYCTEKCIRKLHPTVLNELAEHENFAELICSEKVQLAEQCDSLIKIRGTKGRIEWLKNLRENAKKGGDATKAKWKAKRGPVGLSLARPDEGPITTTTTTTNIYPPDFESLWTLLPRGLKQEAFIRFDSLGGDSKKLQFQKALNNYVAECNRNGTEEKYRMHFSTFIKKRKLSPWLEYVDKTPIVKAHVVPQIDQVAADRVKQERLDMLAKQQQGLAL